VPPKRKPVTNEAIGALVRQQRLKKGISQPDLGKAIGVTEQMVQHYETGRSALSIVRLVDIARALDCKTLDLIP
jgi:transcriptional regulator with XRE-family HTH domain